MSRQELIKSLRLKGEEKAREIWALAECEAARVRAEAAARIERERAGSGSAPEEEALRAIRLAAEREARRLRVAARTRLAERLFEAALAALPALRKQAGSRLFAALAAELPPFAWERLQVNPADRRLAARHFPQAQIAADPAIIGGMIALAEAGRIRIDNTLEKRLERSWETILPALLEKAEEEAERP